MEYFLLQVSLKPWDGVPLLLRGKHFLAPGSNPGPAQLLCTRLGSRLLVAAVVENELNPVSDFHGLAVWRQNFYLASNNIEYLI